MEAGLLMKIMNKYINCPVCGYDKLGEGNGALIVDDNRFERSCRCGFRIVINEKEEVILHHYESNGNTYCGKCKSKVEGGYCDCVAKKIREERSKNV